MIKKHSLVTSAVLAALAVLLLTTARSQPVQEPRDNAGELFYSLVRFSPGQSPDAPLEPKSGRPVEDSSHKVRLHPQLSHISYDDPIVFPNQPGRAHLHQFFNNPTTDAYSTHESLMATPTVAGQSMVNKSAYWTPVLFGEESGRIYLPNDQIWYYSTGIRGRNARAIWPEPFPEEWVQPLPRGMEMLGYGDREAFVKIRKDGNMSLVVHFPSCAAVDEDGNPLTKYTDMGEEAEVNDHVAYRNHRLPPPHCPETHPYPFPRIVMILIYGAIEEPVRLSSGGMDTLHADFMDGWEEGARQAMVEGLRNRTSMKFRNQRGLTEAAQEGEVGQHLFDTYGRWIVPPRMPYMPPTMSPGHMNHDHWGVGVSVVPDAEIVTREELVSATEPEEEELRD